VTVPPTEKQHPVGSSEANPGPEKIEDPSEVVHHVQLNSTKNVTNATRLVSGNNT
jgi:hypothetical protein